MKIPNFRLEKLKKKLRVLYTKRQHVRLEINDGQLLLLIIHVVTVVTLLHCWLLNQSVIEFIVTSIADATHVVHCSLLNYPVLHVFISHMMKNKILLFFFCSVLLRMNRKRGGRDSQIWTCNKLLLLLCCYFSTTPFRCVVKNQLLKMLLHVPLLLLLNHCITMLS